ncbi:MAG: hypothetical protein HGGPFJEG_01903 [Ignavibacteria bacterium]|nr:hypothetical protein [Ignavibacteria bacterium]
MINLKFETISPVHISNGLELSNNLDYVIEGNLLKKLNLFKISEKLLGLHQFSFEKSYSLKEINTIISENIGRFGEEDFIYSVGIDSNMEKLIQSPNTDGQSYVKEFINTNGNFYIPASSVKGAILTILHATKLGIDNAAADIKDKFVFCDSSYLDESLFEVIRFDRPPQVNLLCLKKGSQFEMTIRKKGNFDVSIFKNKLKKYTTIEIAKAKKSIEKWETEKNKESLGSKFYKNALNSLTEVLNSIKQDEYLINLGFGGGTFFKIYDNLETIPKNRKGEDIHTTFSSLIEKERFHIGWCKLKIEEL